MTLNNNNSQQPDNNLSDLPQVGLRTDGAQLPPAQETAPGQRFFRPDTQYEAEEPAQESNPAPAAEPAPEEPAVPQENQRSSAGRALKFIFITLPQLLLLLVFIELAGNLFLRRAEFDDIMLKATQQLDRFEYARAYETVKPAARAGYPPALRVVAKILYFTPSEVDNSKPARELLVRAARGGDALAQVQLLTFPIHDTLNPVWRLEYQADHGDPTAMMELYDIFSAGKNKLPADPAYAKRMLLAAAELNHVRAQHLAGVRYLNGTGVPLDRNKGAQMILASANAGYKHAYPDAAKLFTAGKGVPISRTSALKWIIVTKNTPGLAIDSELKVYLSSIADKVTKQEREQAYKEATEFVAAHPQTAQEPAIKL